MNEQPTAETKFTHSRKQDYACNDCGELIVVTRRLDGKDYCRECDEK